MASKAKAVRGKFVEEKYMGTEPDLRGIYPPSDLDRAYNWYNHFYNSEEAKAFAIAYLKDIKYNKETVKKLGQVSAYKLNTVGWNCRILSLGGNLPDNVKTNLFGQIDNFAKTAVSEPAAVEITKTVVSIQDRINEKVIDLIGDLEEQIDIFCTDKKSDFNISAWLRQKDVKPQIAIKIAEKYKPLYTELVDVAKGKDDQLAEAYRFWKKSHLKAYTEFVKKIITECESRNAALKTIRKPRKKKEKSATTVVSKLKFKEEDKDFNIKSVRAADIVGSNQLWVFNTKTRNLSVYNALGPIGLSVKGTSIIGFDEKDSITKKIRKPEATLPEILSGGKIALRKLMPTIKAKDNPANGRINTDVILLRIIK